MNTHEALRILVEKSPFDEASKLQVLNLLEDMTEEDAETLGRFFAKYHQEIIERKKEAIQAIDTYLQTQ